MALTERVLGSFTLLLHLKKLDRKISENIRYLGNVFNQTNTVCHEIVQITSELLTLIQNDVPSLDIFRWSFGILLYEMATLGECLKKIYIFI